jgi:hypothetical protein
MHLLPFGNLIFRRYSSEYGRMNCSSIIVTAIALRIRFEAQNSHKSWSRSSFLFEVYAFPPSRHSKIGYCRASIRYLPDDLVASPDLVLWNAFLKRLSRGSINQLHELLILNGHHSLRRRCSRNHDRSFWDPVATLKVKISCRISSQMPRFPLIFAVK